MQTDRRRHQRFPFKQQVYAVFKPEPVRIVPIVNIGLGGMAVSDSDNLVRTEQVTDLEIMSSDCSFYIENVPFQIVSVLDEIEPHADVPEYLRTIRLKFGRLTGRQAADLRHLIRHYCTGSHRPRAARRLAGFFEQFRAPRESKDSYRDLFHNAHRPTM